MTVEERFRPPAADAVVRTERLVVRPWSEDDAEAALAVYGTADVSRWLTPAMDRVEDLTAMLALLRAWREEQPTLAAPEGRWAVQRVADGVVIGSVGIRALPPQGDDLELTWQLAPSAWGRGGAGAGALGLRPRRRRALRGRAPDQPAGHRDRRAARHAVGRRDRQVLRAAPAGLPDPARRPPRLTGCSWATAPEKLTIK
jgi:hypothetical protein